MIRALLPAALTLVAAAHATARPVPTGAVALGDRVSRHLSDPARAPSPDGGEIMPAAHAGHAVAMTGSSSRARRRPTQTSRGRSASPSPMSVARKDSGAAAEDIARRTDEGFGSRLPTVVGYVFMAAGAAMLVGGLVLVFKTPAGFALIAFGLVFAGAGHLAQRLFTPPEGKRAVPVHVYETEIRTTDGRRGVRREAGIIHVDADATEEEIEAARAEWRREQWERRPDWIAGRIASEDGRDRGTLYLAVGLWSLFALAAAAAAVFWDGFFRNVAIAAALVAGFLAVQAVRGTLRLREFGASHLVLARTPVVLGGVLDGTVESGISGGEAPPMGFHVRLRCVHRWEETSRYGSDDRRPTRYHRDVLWEEGRRTGGRATAKDGSLSIPVRFRLPADQPVSTPARSGERIFWEVEVTAEMEGLDYDAVFEIPVLPEGTEPWNTNG